MHAKFLLITLFLFSSFIVSAQDKSYDKSDSERNGVSTVTVPPNNINVIRVKDSIYMLKGRGGNIGVSVGENGIFMIDAQFAEASFNIQQRIRSISKKPLEILINTHHHPDHIGGNSSIAELGTMIFSHSNARSRMEASFGKSDIQKIDSIIQRSEGKIRTEEDKKDVMMNAKRIVSEMPKTKSPEGALPVVSFSEDITFNYNGEEIKVIHLSNAHTDGDVMVYFTKSNVLHTGDAFFNGKYPYVDLKSKGSLKGHVEGLIRILRTVNPDTKIIPGHGEIATIEDVKYTIGMFRFLTENVKFQIASKKTESEITAMRDFTKEYDEKGYGDGFITTESFLKMLYSELARKR